MSSNGVLYEANINKVGTKAWEVSLSVELAQNTVGSQLRSEILKCCLWSPGCFQGTFRSVRLKVFIIILSCLFSLLRKRWWILLLTFSMMKKVGHSIVLPLQCVCSENMPFPLVYFGEYIKMTGYFAY